MRKHSLFIKLIMVFFILILPLYIAFIWIFNWSEHIVKEEIRQSNISNLEYLQIKLEDSFKSFENIQSALFHDEFIQEFNNSSSTMSNMEQEEWKKMIEKRLSVAISNNQLVQDITILFPHKEISINGKGDSSYSDLEYKKLLTSITNNKGIVKMDDFDVYTAAISSTKDQEVMLIRVDLCKEKLKTFITQFEKNNRSQIVIYAHEYESFTTNNYERVLNKSIDILKEHHIIHQFDWSEKEDLNKEIQVGQIEYLFASQYSSYMDTSLVAILLLDDIFYISKSFGGYMVFFTSLVILVLVIFICVAYSTVMKPMAVLLQAFGELEKGEMKVQIHSRASYEFQHLFTGFNKMVNRLNIMINKVYVQEIYKNKEELRRLQTQINPHFLYNSHFILSRMIKDGDMESAAQFASYLGEHYKYMTRNTRSTIKLGEEYEHVKNYASIQEMRYSGRLDIQMPVLPCALRDIDVPRMILQPVIENSIKYGAMYENIHFGIVEVNIEDKEDLIIITVEDNGTSITDKDIDKLQMSLQDMSDDIEVTGLININRRLNIVYGPEGGVSVGRSAKGGLRVSLSFYKNM